MSVLLTSGYSLPYHPTQSTEGVMSLDNVPTATYCAVLDGRGEMRCGIGDMDASDHVSPQWVEQHSDKLQSSSIVLMDGNIPLATMSAVCQLCREKGIQGTSIFFNCVVLVVGVV